MIYNKVRLYRQLFRQLSTQSIKTIKPQFKLIDNWDSLNHLKYSYFQRNDLIFSKLKNGMKVVTLDNERRIKSLTLLIKVGTRLETKKYFGSSKLLHDLVIYSDNKYKEDLNLVDKFYSNGSILSSGYNREFTSFLLEYLQDNKKDQISTFLNSVFKVFRMNIEDKDLEKLKENTLNELRIEPENMDVLIDELLHSVAWNNNTLGNKQLINYEDLLSINKESLVNFRNNYFSPENTIVIGSGIKHQDLINKIIKSSIKNDIYSSCNFLNKEKVKLAKYTGGMKIIKTKEDIFTNVLIAVETNLNWKSSDLISLLTLQSYLGGGSSFSVGGPGKGMYSKLFLDVLNKLDWVESCNSFINQYSDSGIFGIQITSIPGFVMDSIKTIASQISEIKNICEPELERAKNMLKSNISMIYEDRNFYIEDIAKHILCYSEYIAKEELFRCIDNIKVADIRKLAEIIISNIEKPTIIAIGSDVDQLPKYDEVVSLLKKATTRL